MTINFMPHDSTQVNVPFFEDVTSDDGWQGHATTKSVKALQSEISSAIGRLGGFVSGFQQGTFTVDGKERDGFQIHYSIQNPSGQLVPGRIDIAALPVKSNRRDARKTHKEKSLRMALYMVAEALNGAWFMQQLSPGYAALMPWMLAGGGKTVSQLWHDSPVMSGLLPPGGDFESDDSQS